VSSKTAQGRRVTSPGVKLTLKQIQLIQITYHMRAFFLVRIKYGRQNQTKSACDCLPDTNSQRLGIETSIPNQKNCGEARTSFNFLAVENLLCMQGIKLAVALNMGLCAMIV
jgi:hypothetical protein